MPPRLAISEGAARLARRRIPEDQAFQEAFCRRCPAAWTLVFAGLSNVFRKHIRHVLPRHMDREEVLSETWYRAYKYADRYDPARPLVPWLLTVCHRACLREYERHYRREKHSGEAVPSERGASDAQPVDAPDTFAALLSALPERDQEVLALRLLHDLSTAAVAEVLGVSQAVIRQRFARALDRVRNRPWPSGLRRNGTVVRTRGE